MVTLDAIVIGCGNAGLTATASLQPEEGAKTLLLDRHNVPGGCATSFMRGKFEFEVALHQLSGERTKQQPFIQIAQSRMKRCWHFSKPHNTNVTAQKTPCFSNWSRGITLSLKML